MGMKPLASQRDAALAQLRQHYVHNTIAVDAYERRVEHVTQADDLEQMNLALADLQPLVVPETKSRALAMPLESRAPIVAVFGSTVRRGNWLSAQTERVVTVFGNAELSLTELPPGVTTLDIGCVFGNVELTVPSSVHVEMHVRSILANAEDHARTAAPQDGAPVLRIRGVCIFGNVEINRR